MFLYSMQFMDVRIKYKNRDSKALTTTKTNIFALHTCFAIKYQNQVHFSDLQKAFSNSNNNTCAIAYKKLHNFLWSRSTALIRQGLNYSLYAYSSFDVLYNQSFLLLCTICVPKWLCTKWGLPFNLQYATYDCLMLT